jgi:hypothetical protein
MNLDRRSFSPGGLNVPPTTCQSRDAGLWTGGRLTCRAASPRRGRRGNGGNFAATSSEGPGGPGPTFPVKQSRMLGGKVLIHGF